ncbi:hypothetical protein E8E11_000177 [Didymella keratinophila]|nr:hypothetical protein E8E11_000177 [Didymella keratinophila]
MTASAKESPARRASALSELTYNPIRAPRGTAPRMGDIRRKEALRQYRFYYAAASNLVDYRFKLQNKAWKSLTKEAYTDANKLVDAENVKNQIDWNSAAALQFLGPSGLNKNEQGQVQTVFRNVATVHEGTSWYTPNWIDSACPQDDDDPKCPPEYIFNPDDGEGDTTAYVRNPDEHGNQEKYSKIAFCKQFFDYRNLGNAMAYDCAPSHPIMKSDVRKYHSRANIFLYELFHLDLAADSKNDSPNHQIKDLKIKDLKIKFIIGTGDEDERGKVTKWGKVYGARYAKTLARFQPIRRDVSLGYFVQRSDENLVQFALAQYVQSTFGFYPYIPITWDQIKDMRRLPAPRRRDPDVENVIAFNNVFNSSSSVVANLADEGGCPATMLENQSGEYLEIGAPLDKSAYPDDYLKQYYGWLKDLKDYLDGEASDWRQEMCFNTDQDMDLSRLAPPLADSGFLFDAVAKRACSTLPDYVTDKEGGE